jgi:parallel beta-helix repeat protein
LARASSRQSTLRSCNLLFLYTLLLFAATDEEQLRARLKNPTGVIELSAGVVEVSSEIVLPADAHDLEIRGAKEGTVLRATTTFHGRAIFVAQGGTNIKFHDFEIAGNRAALAPAQGLPPYDVPFTRFTKNSGIAVEGIKTLSIANLKMREIAGFALLINHSAGVKIENVEVEDSGAQNAKKRNNTTGGILLEEGTTDFEITRCTLKNIRGNGIWTHSRYESPRNARGRIAGNSVDHAGRDAYQVGHAVEIRVENNTAMAIGFPESEVDAENGGIPVALDTAGNVEKSVYAGNHFSETNGKCIDLDGFHDGEIRDNICENRQPPEAYKFGNYGIVMNNSNPDMQSRNVRITGNTLDGTLFGGIFIIGSGNTVTRNRLLNINMAHCPENAKRFGCFLAADEPDILRTGIYLGRGAHRPDIAAGNTVEDNFITGFGMGNHCLGTAPGVALEKNRVARNECSDDTMVNARNRVYQFPVGYLFEAVDGKILAVAPR